MFVILNECEETCSPPVGAKGNLANVSLCKTPLGR